MVRTIDVVIAGRPSCDVVFTALREWPALGREIHADGLAVAAGGHFNTAAALARLGVSVALVATVGDDVWGEVVLRDAIAEDIPREWIRVLPGTPTPVSVALNVAGDRGFVTFAPGWDAAADDFVERARTLVGSGRVRHLHGDLSSASDVLIPAAREAGATVSLDAHEAGPWLASARVAELASAADVVFLNEDEARAIVEVDDVEAALTALSPRIPHLVLKRGSRGAASVVEGMRRDVGALAADVVDATGAGDCFVAGYLARLLAGRPPDECLAFANECGAAAVRRPGGFAAAPRLDVVAAES